MSGQSNEIRQRKTANKKKNNRSTAKTASESSSTRDPANPPSTTTATNSSEDDDPTNETLSETFFNHPLIKVAPFLLMPYAVYYIVCYVSLQHPEWVNLVTGGLIALRPSMTQYDPRQVLIIGSEVQINRHLVAGLVGSSKLDLEISHEIVDASQNFCRDGTVSWFQIMRFLKPWNDEELTNPKENSNKDNRWGKKASTLYDQFQFQAWNELCLNRTKSLVSLFHPKHYSSSATGCSSRDNWSQCWARECLTIVTSMWGCVWREKDDDTSSPCIPPFARVLHQVRHPLSTIQQLNSSFCDSDTEAILESFIALVSSWFPFEPSLSLLKSHHSMTTQSLASLLDWADLSCLDSMAMYVIQFHTTMLLAQKAGLVHDRFQLENTSPCEVALKAGFLESYTSIYEASIERLIEKCPFISDMDNYEDESGKALSTKNRLTDAQNPNTFLNLGDPKMIKSDGTKEITFDDFARESSSDLVVELLRELIRLLGYDEDRNSHRTNGNTGEFDY